MLKSDPSLAEGPNGLDADCAEAAGLGHDLGHPPFGHIAEAELNRLVREAGLLDGFEGNAQSLRIVVRLAASDAESDDDRVAGLNLSRASLNGLLKYPWSAGSAKGTEKKKWGYYESEKNVYDWIRKDSDIDKRSLTAEVMDWADDITFAIHDLLDFFVAGLIPIDRLKDERGGEFNLLLKGILGRKGDELGCESEVADSLKHVAAAFPFPADFRFHGSRQDHTLLHGFASSLITSFIGAFEVSQRKICVQQDARRQVEILKQFTWEYVILNPDLASKQMGQRKAIRTVFERLHESAVRREFHIFPSDYRTELEEADSEQANLVVRVVADCVAGMTERELMRFYRRIEGMVE